MPRKLGQHFLVRDAILEKLAIAACGEHAPRVIEIGPGRGALTRHLLPRTDELHVVELDQGLAARLKSKFAAEPKLQVHIADVLGTDLAQWGGAVIAGNLPYYITSPIIEEFLALDERFPLAVFLVQWEVAERINAKPGTRAYGYLTVATQLVCDVELISKVPASAFIPPPKVDSGAVKLVRKNELPKEKTELLQFVGRCFGHKRKTLRNNLRPFYGKASDALPESGLRAEQLAIDRFIDLYERLSYTDTS
ncbi:MAG: ribosomal RNA small subunit methyltransferase A [Acidobacteriaceae bacterium]|nr:ribosomal RNA small subunit methyltransferase A [Acidobacteriaceae bacterium]MBV9293987.1 ribosomal RNA small subunit methyltransferase A [Acidobacteriaceae bacterium]MBV9765873.1 ribosomal RNA small subunit methyltransferase A [Acidobacteriaceae bacterium]